MFTVHARSVASPGGRFQPTRITRRSPGPQDVVIDIAYAGICHSDLDHAYSTRGHTHYPLVPGHEIAGTVTAIGSAVTRYGIGDRVGVGNMVDSCRTCAQCVAGLQQYCSGRRVLTYNSADRNGEITQGGYSGKIVVDEAYVLRIPDGLALANAAPLFCAGITLYSPLRHWRAGPGKRVGIVGMGGLGHVGVQIARALGAAVTVFDVVPDRHDDAIRLGAGAFVLTTDSIAFDRLASTFDLIISTVPASIDLDPYVELLARDGTLVSLGVPDQPLRVSPYGLLRNRRSIAGSLSGGIPETQEMIGFCAAHGIGAEVEIIDAGQIDDAYARLLAGDVRYRFVIDIATMSR